MIKAIAMQVASPRRGPLTLIGQRMGVVNSLRVRYLTCRLHVLEAVEDRLL